MWICCWTPTVPIPPPRIAELKANPTRCAARDHHAGAIRARSMCGESGDFRSRRIHKDGHADWTATGSAPWHGIVLLQAANAYEQATEWHKKSRSWQNHVGTDAFVIHDLLSERRERGGREKNRIQNY